MAPRFCGLTIKCFLFQEGKSYHKKVTDYNYRDGIGGGYLNPLFSTRKRDETRSNGRARYDDGQREYDGNVSYAWNDDGVNDGKIRRRNGRWGHYCNGRQRAHQIGQRFESRQRSGSKNGHGGHAEKGEPDDGTMSYVQKGVV
jgi:hypothetical protein